jgi:DNA repair exonuclease SbcCD ATPase subunit
MKDSNSTKSQGPASTTASDAGFSPWQRLKGKRISYLTLPLLFMATVTEFVILATGWKYQQVVCLPQGMGVTFLGIGPIGATILAVELLKLPLAIWTASRVGWQKVFMLCIGLPLICVLTFQLVKDMAVYEMGVAMTPANQFLEKASAEDTKIAHLNDELKVVQQKKSDRDQRLAELSAKQAKLKGELEETLKRIDASRQDAINLTEYQKKELSEVDTRQANIIKQFNADTETITKAIADLRARRETEVSKATKWNAEEARIENEYKTKLSEYTNKKGAYDKARKEYDSANFLHRQLMSEPIDPGVPPVREVNTILKPTLVDDLEQQIKAKEAELVDINNKRRERVAQVDSDARRIRSEYDQRSTTKRAESDKTRDELTAALAALAKEEKAEHERIDKDFTTVSDTTDGMRAQIDASRKAAEGFYEAREAAIRKTQVHRIATTVEIVRGLIKGERPMSIKATAKERGDILTDQISMVRIWVYPVLAFIIAFLPTLMVEIGFSTIFQPEPVRPVHRLGFMGRRLHALEVRAGRIKNLRDERLTSDAAAKIAARDKALAQTKAAAENALAEARAAAEEALAEAKANSESELTDTKADLEKQLAETKADLEQELARSRAASDRELAQTKAAAEKAQSEKDAELEAAREALATAQAKHTEEYKNKESEWMMKLANMADSLNRTVVEKDALRDMQKAEIERQVQMRQNAWSDRMTQMRKELDEQRSASEEERNALIEEHHKKLMEVTEDCKTQVIQARRQMADAELAAVEKTARLEHDLKEALHARDAAEVQLKHQTDTLSVKLAQAQEETNRQVEKITRQEKHRFERQQMEFDKKLRQRDEDVERQLKQCEHELSLGFDARLAEEKNKTDLENRRKMAEFERQFDARSQEVDLRWKQEIQQREDVAAFRLKQREEQLQTQFDGKIRDFQGASEEQLRRREEELERQFEAKARELETRIGKDLQAKEQNFQAKLKQREEELAIKAQSREIELQKQLTADLRVREEDWEKQAQARVKAVEARFTQEAQQKEEVFAAKTRQRDEQWQVKLEGVQAELRNATAAIEPLKAQVTRAEQERDEAKVAAADGFRQVQSLEKKLGEVSNFLSGWRNGKNVVEA